MLRSYYVKNYRFYCSMNISVNTLTNPHILVVKDHCLQIYDLPAVIILFIMNDFITGPIRQVTNKS